MKDRKLIFLMVAMVVMTMAAGCTKSNPGITSLYTPTSSDATSTATLEELQSGRTLYINNCNSCHDLYSPDNYSATQWKSIVGNMGPRTNMTTQEISLVTKYVSRGK